MKTINKSNFLVALFLLVFCIASCGYDNKDKDLVRYSLDKDTKMKFIPLKPGTTTVYTADEIKQVKTAEIYDPYQGKYDPYEENKYKLSQNVNLRLQIANFELKKFEVLDNSNQDKVIHTVTKATKQGGETIVSISKTMKELGFKKKDDGTFDGGSKNFVFRVTYQSGVLDFYEFKVSRRKETKFIPLKPGTKTPYTADEIKQANTKEKYNPYEQNKYKLSESVNLKFQIPEFGLKKFEILDSSDNDKVIHTVTKATKEGANSVVSVSKTMKELGFEKKSDGTFNVDSKDLVFKIAYQNGISLSYDFKVSAQK